MTSERQHENSNVQIHLRYRALELDCEMNMELIGTSVRQSLSAIDLFIDQNRYKWNRPLFESVQSTHTPRAYVTLQQILSANHKILNIHRMSSHFFFCSTKIVQSSNRTRITTMRKVVFVVAHDSPIEIQLSYDPLQPATIIRQNVDNSRFQ